MPKKDYEGLIAQSTVRTSDIRNPGVPENFFTLYTLFRDQLYGRSTFKSKDLSPDTRQSIIVLEETIQELDYTVLLDAVYADHMHWLCYSQSISTEELEQRMKQLPILIQNAKQQKATAAAEIIGRRTYFGTEIKLKALVELTSQLQLSCYMVKVGRGDPETTINWRQSFCNQRDILHGNLVVLKGRNFCHPVLEALLDLCKEYDHVDEQTVTPEQWADIAQLSDIVTGFVENRHERVSPNELNIKRAAVTELSESEGIHPPATTIKTATLEETVLELWLSQYSLSRIFREKYTAEAALEKHLGLAQELEQIVSSKRCLEEAHSACDGEFRALQAESTMLAQILKRREYYGVSWKEALIKFQVMERNLYKAWGKKMVAAGFQSIYLEFGHQQGYF
jgi:hypothetical protein